MINKEADRYEKLDKMKKKKRKGIEKLFERKKEKERC